jgi:hypothetical protein
VVALAAPATALGAGNRISVSSPHRVKKGVGFTFHAKGNSASGGNSVATFLNTGTKCYRTYDQELLSPFGPSQAKASLRKGRFSLAGRVIPRSTGPHYVCAYLINSASQQTLARASSKYVTKR